MKYTVKDILNIAVRSEEEAELFYTRLMDKTDSVFFKEKLKFLANEEKKHKSLILKLMEKKGVRVGISEDKAISLEMPSLVFNDSEPISVLIQAAMKAENAARIFYFTLSEHVSSQKEKSLLRYLSSVEASHYHILEGELEAIQHFEDYDEFNEMMHAGP